MASCGSTPARPGTVTRGMVYVASPVLVTAKLPWIVPAGAVTAPAAPEGAAGLFALRDRHAATIGCGGDGCWLDEHVHPGATTHPRTRKSTSACILSVDIFFTSTSGAPPHRAVSTTSETRRSDGSSPIALRSRARSARA